MACEELLEAYLDAQRAYDRARLNTEAADNNLDAARWAYAGGLIGEVGCGFLVETVIGFIFCEGVAVSAAESGAEWMESAEAGLELAELAEQDAEDALEQARDAWCECLRR